MEKTQIVKATEPPQNKPKTFLFPCRIHIVTVDCATMT